MVYFLIQQYYLFNTDILSRNGPQDYEYVGIEPTTFIEQFPDAKFSETKKIVAEELNKKFGTNFTEKDIKYFKEGWMDY